MLPSSSPWGDYTSDHKLVNMEHTISLSPFDLIGLWDKETIANVSVSMDTSPVAQFSFNKHLIKFTNGHYSSNTMKIDNVFIPFSSEGGYGHNYIYICLPHVIEKLIKRNAPKTYTNLVGSKYHGEAGEWWKLAYNIEGVFKIADKNQICTPVSLAKILNHTKMGVRANILAEFSIIKHGEEFVIDVQIVSGYITSMGVEIKPPTPLGIIPGRPTPQDITSDDIIKNLEMFTNVPKKIEPVLDSWT